MAIIGLVCLVIIAGVGLLLTFSLIKPIKDVVERIKDIGEGEGDLTARLVVKNRDEVGELAQGFNAFIDKLQSMVRNIAANAVALNTSATDLSDKVLPT